MPHSVASQDAK